MPRSRRNGAKWPDIRPASRYNVSSLATRTARPNSGRRRGLDRSMSHSLSARLAQETVAALVSEGYPTIERAARALDCSPRTLQRRLHEEGLTYGELVDRVRADAARRLMEDPSRHLYEVASALGFADPSSFSRFFRRMTGVAPRQYRHPSP